MNDFNVIEAITDLLTQLPEWLQWVAFAMVFLAAYKIRNAAMRFVGFVVNGSYRDKWLQNEEGMPEKVRCRKRGSIPKGYRRELEQVEIDNLVSYGKQPMLCDGKTIRSF